MSFAAAFHPSPRCLAGLVAALLCLGASGAAAEQGANPPPAAESVTLPPPPCAYLEDGEVLSEWRAAIARGEVSDPRARALPALPPARRPGARSAARDLTSDDLFLFEDTEQLLLTDWTLPQLLDLMVSAANALLAVHGDTHDFIGFWLSYEPHHLYGGAFFWALENDVSGIGKELFNRRAEYGLAGENIEGMLMLYDVNSYWWAPPGGDYADFTQLMISHEFEHRFAMNLPDLLDGRALQGDADPAQGGPCGKRGHWSYRVDGQGSAMEIREWVGSQPAVLDESYWMYNTDIPWSVWSYPDLYLMGYVSPEEMDAYPSELRSMDATPDCAPQYDGPISPFTSVDIIAASGPRVPDHEAAQKDFRCAWIMLHLPGDPPTPSELDKAVAILQAHQLTWLQGSLGRGHMDHSLGDANTSAGDPAAGDPAPLRLILGPVTPNPFNPRTRIHFSLSEPARISLRVHDVAGRCVAELLRDAPWPAGEHSLLWQGRGKDGGILPSGVYFLRLDSGALRQSSKAVLLN